MTTRRGVQLLFSIALLSASFQPVSAQADSTRPSARIMKVCEAFRLSLTDLVSMADAISNEEEKIGAIELGNVAAIAHERCVSVHSLLFVYELLSAGPARQKAGEYIAFRMGQYAILKTDIEYANKMMGVTRQPGTARESQGLRDRLRSFADMVTALAPK